MPERIRYYMDEHVPRAVTEGLSRRGVDALTVQAASMQGADDEHQLTFAAEAGRVIFTQDADFLRLHADGKSHHGIAYAPQGASVGYIIRGLMLVHEILSPQDMTDHVEFL